MPTAQMGAIAPLGLKKKKKQLYAPLVQEQARAGIATQMVMDRKNNEAQEEAKGLQQAELDFARENAAQQDQQWKADYELSQRAQAQQMQMAQDSLSAQKRQNNVNMVLGGLSTAASLFDAFDFGWSDVMELF